MSDGDREKAVRDWFAGYAKENPELAKAAAVSDGANGAVTKTVPITNGTANSGKGPDDKSPPVITTGKFAGKTAAPGHPNSMTAAEYSAWKREYGYSY